jgi:hypothetical protein
VSTRLIGRRVRVLLDASELVICDGRAEVARHERLPGRSGRSGLRLDLDHYLEPLVRKAHGDAAGTAGCAGSRRAFSAEPPTSSQGTTLPEATSPGGCTCTCRFEKELACGLDPRVVRDVPAHRQRSNLAGWAGCGYCASHSRFFWGPAPVPGVHPSGMPILWVLANPELGEREVLTTMLEAEARVVAEHPCAPLRGVVDRFDQLAHGLQ